MNEISKKFTFEQKMRKITQIWTIIIVLLFVIFSCIYILSAMSVLTIKPAQQVSPNGQNTSSAISNGTYANIVNTVSSNSNKSVNFVILSSFYVLILILTVIVSIRMKAGQIEKEITNLYSELHLIKIHRSKGSVSLQENDELQIEWTRSGYFVLSHNGKELGFAKSSELYWKILYLKHEILK